MASAQVTLVTGVGKTRWIREYLGQMGDLPIYGGAGSGSLALEVVHLRTAFPGLQVVLDSQAEVISEKLTEGIPLVVEMGFHRDPVEM